MAEAKGSATSPRLAVVIFSKDRPFQLSACLSTLLRSFPNTQLEVSILFKASSASFRASYRCLEALFATSVSSSSPVCRGRVRWLEEDPTDSPGEPKDRGLGALLDDAIAAAEASGIEHLLFTVDDALWIQEVDVASGLALLRERGDIYALHAKLGPRIEYAHPNNKFMRVPRFTTYWSEGQAKPGSWLHFERDQGEYDWNYPWELSGSIYRLKDVQEMLEALRSEFGEVSVNHPNRLEGDGMQLFKKQKVSAAKQTKRSACLNEAAVVVVTINRVQTLFSNPIFGDTSDGEASVEELDLLWRRSVRAAILEDPALKERLGLPEDFWEQFLDGKQGLDGRSEEPNRTSHTTLDACLAPASELSKQPPGSLLRVEPYKAAYLDSVHVPLLSRQSLVGPTTSSADKPLVSWLLPVKDTPPEWLHEALESIHVQRGVPADSYEVVLVDDGSSDPSTLSYLATLEAPVRVVPGEGRGLGAALNMGWKAARGDFVVRLDGDDVAHPDRLLKQLKYMAGHPSLSILGGGFCTFRESRELQENELRAKLPRYRMSCHPVLAKWKMLFGCSLAHPTVMFRKASFGGVENMYPEDEEAEDHCCWLNQPLDCEYGNVADVVCYIRRHGVSRSATKAAALKLSSHRGVLRFLQRHCNIEVLQIEDIAVLWGTANISSAEQAKRLSVALDAIERLFASNLPASPEHAEAFALAPRRQALLDFFSATCSKLRGLCAVQALADGDLSSGTAMMQLWLNSSGTAKPSSSRSGGKGEKSNASTESGAPQELPGAALKSLGALIGAGFPGGF